MESQGNSSNVSACYLDQVADKPDECTELTDASFEHGVAIVDMLTDEEIRQLRKRIMSIDCVAARTELAQETIMAGLIHALPHYVAAREAFRKDSTRRDVRGMKPRFHRANLLNDIAQSWLDATGETGTLWVKPRKGKTPLASPVVQIAMAAGQSIGDTLSVRGWRSQIPIAEEILVRTVEITESEKG